MEMIFEMNENKNNILLTHVDNDVVNYGSGLIKLKLVMKGGRLEWKEN